MAAVCQPNESIGEAITFFIKRKAMSLIKKKKETLTYSLQSLNPLKYSLERFPTNRIHKNWGQCRAKEPDCCRSYLRGVVSKHGGFADIGKLWFWSHRQVCASFWPTSRICQNVLSMGAMSLFYFHLLASAVRVHIGSNMTIWHRK